MSFICCLLRSGFAPLELYDGIDLQYRTAETLNNDLDERTWFVWRPPHIFRGFSHFACYLAVVLA